MTPDGAPAYAGPQETRQEQTHVTARSYEVHADYAPVNENREPQQKEGDSASGKNPPAKTKSLKRPQQREEQEKDPQPQRFRSVSNRRQKTVKHIRRDTSPRDIDVLIRQQQRLLRIDFRTTSK